MTSYEIISLIAQFIVATCVLIQTTASIIRDLNFKSIKLDTHRNTFVKKISLIRRALSRPLRAGVLLLFINIIFMLMSGDVVTRPFIIMSLYSAVVFLLLVQALVLKSWIIFFDDFFNQYISRLDPKGLEGVDDKESCRDQGQNRG